MKKKTTTAKNTDTDTKIKTELHACMYSCVKCRGLFGVTTGATMHRC